MKFQEARSGGAERKGTTLLKNIISGFNLAVSLQPKIFSSPEMDYRELQTILHIIGYLLLKVRDYPFTKLGITSPSVA